jgi:hypothetical protein
MQSLFVYKNLKKPLLVIVFSLVLFSIFIFKAKAEVIQYDWGKSIIGSSQYYINGLKTDSSGNVYTMGRCNGSFDFDPTASQDIISCSFAFFISKYDINGNYQWTRVISSSSNNFVEPRDLAVDALGNIVVGGEFYGTIDFDGTSGTASRTASTSYSSAFIVKYLSNGDFAFEEAWGSTACSTKLVSIGIDQFNDVFASGSFSGTCTVDLDGTSGGISNLTNPNAPYERLYISKYSNTGAFLWAKNYGGTSNAYVIGMKLDSAGNAYLGGSWAGTNIDFNFDAGTDLHTASGYDSYLMKVSNAGSFQWARTFGGTGYDMAKQIVVDSNNYVYLVGLFSSPSVDFDPTAGSDIITNSSGGNWGYYTKYSSIGGYEWTRYNKVTNMDYLRVTTDSSNSLYLYGRYSGNIDFTTNHSSTDIISSNAGSDDVYLTKIYLNGTYAWTKRIGGSGAEGIGSVVTNSVNDVFFTGYFASTTLDIDPDPSIINNVSNSGSNDIFLIKLNSSGNLLVGAKNGGTLSDSGGSVALYGTNTFLYTGIFSSNPLDLDPTSGENNATGPSSFLNKITYTSGITPTVTPIPVPTAIPPAPPEESGVEIVDENFEDVLQTNLQGVVTLGVVDIISGAPIALLDIDTSLVSGEFIWDSLTGASSGTRSVLHYPGGIDDLPGISGGEFILFVAKGDGTSVLICPGATTLNQVIIGCSNGYFLDEYAPNVTIENINGIDYWRVTGLSGTGGMSVIMGIKDVLSRLQVDVLADHRMSFGTNYGINSGDNLVIEFDPTNKAFDLTGLTISDIVLTDSSSNDRTLAGTAGAGIWGVSIDTVNDSITFTAPTNNVGLFEEAKAVIVIIGGTNKIKNPANVSSVQEVVTIYNTIGEQGTVSIPIVDSDTVDISGYVTAFIHFDIDTNTDNTDCAYNVCKVHGGIGAGTADNYTVDLGELTSTLVNKSNSMSVNHSDGGTGIINSIYFDLTSNSPGGAVVTVKSLNSGLKGPGTTNLIASVSDGLDIEANSGLYGFNLTTGSTQKYGSIVANILCDLATEFCGPTSTPKTVFDTNNLPIDSARVRMDLAAAASYTNNPGVYTDTLTFVATGTF